ncbi:MAG: hypothetical protein Q9208_001423 [Pyrenodesmia sp. 3 TL-2023]
MATAAIGGALTGAAVQMIGPISETLTQVIQFSILDFFTPSTDDSSSSSSDAQNTIVRIRAGADDGGVQKDLGGNTPIVVGYDMNLNRVGDSLDVVNHDFISNGQFANVQLSGGRQTPTLEFTAGGTDGICISDVYMKWADNQGFAFEGGWFKWCNMWWYHSSITLTTSSGDRYQPPCGWLDMDASNGHSLVGFRVDMLELQNIPNINAWSKEDVQSYCTNTFQFSASVADQYLKSNIATTGDENAKGSKRALENPSSSRNKTLSVTDTSGRRKKLVVSEYEGQSAQELCDSDKSRGPDFVSMAEGKYCDMSEKKTYQLCSGSTRRECFSLDQENKRLRRRGGVKDASSSVHREYGKVDRWGPA